MTGEQLTKHRAGLGLTQEGMVVLLGCSLISYKRYETDARPISAYIAHSVLAIVILAKHGLGTDFTKALKKA